MAQTSSHSLSTLKALTYRITTTPPQDLPPIAAQISACIWNCRELISVSSETKQTRETTDVLKRFNTRIGTLLQDRSIEGRWAAVVLVKATIEAGGIEVLSKSNAWARILLGYLKKPDPPTTRSLAVVTLTRIFMLTWDHSSLVREITTPNLGVFVPTCLSNLENKRCSSSEFQTILEALVTLVPKHPTIFRTNEAKLRSILSSVLSGTSLQSGGQIHYTEALKSAAERLLVLLHHCAPKQGSREKWAETMKTHIQAAHATCDRIFRAVQENWQSSADVEPSTSLHQIINGEVEIESEDAAGLKPWKGVYAGAERLAELLRIIEAHLNIAVSASVDVQIGVLQDLLSRIFNVLPPTRKQEAVKANNQISKDEREAMFAVLPQIHVAALRLTTSIYHRFGLAVLSLAQNTLEQVLPVFEADREDNVRQSIFLLVEIIVDRCGLSMTKNDVSDLGPILKSACQELLVKDDSKATTQAAASVSTAQATQSNPTTRPAIDKAAEKLLTTAIRRIDAASLSPQLRAQIDRAAILTRSQDILIASVMNPAKRPTNARLESSLMPILAREFSNSVEAEALLRPRMPLVTAAKKSFGEPEELDEFVEDDDDEQEAHDDEMQEVDAEAEEARNGAEEEDEHIEPSTTFAVSEAASSSSSKPANTVAATPEISSTGKRRAVETVDVESSTKRTRTASPASQITQAGPSTTITSSQATFTTAVPDFGDEDSDMEIPEINPDPDTDLEDAVEDGE